MKRKMMQFFYSTMLFFLIGTTITFIHNASAMQTSSQTGWWDSLKSQVQKKINAYVWRPVSRFIKSFNRLRPKTNYNNNVQSPATPLFDSRPLLKSKEAKDENVLIPQIDPTALQTNNDTSQYRSIEKKASLQTNEPLELPPVNEDFIELPAISIAATEPKKSDNTLLAQKPAIAVIQEASNPEPVIVNNVPNVNSLPVNTVQIDQATPAPQEDTANVALEFSQNSPVPFNNFQETKSAPDQLIPVVAPTIIPGGSKKTSQEAPSLPTTKNIQDTYKPAMALESEKSIAKDRPNIDQPTTALEPKKSIAKDIPKIISAANMSWGDFLRTGLLGDNTANYTQINNALEHIYSFFQEGTPSEYKKEHISNIMLLLHIVQEVGINIYEFQEDEARRIVDKYSKVDQELTTELEKYSNESVKYFRDIFKTPTSLVSLIKEQLKKIFDFNTKKFMEKNYLEQILGLLNNFDNFKRMALDYDSESTYFMCDNIIGALMLPNKDNKIFALIQKNPRTIQYQQYGIILDILLTHFAQLVSTLPDKIYLKEQKNKLNEQAQKYKETLKQVLNGVAD